MENYETELAILTAYHHYNAQYKKTKNSHYTSVANDLWLALQELKQYHTLKETFFPDITPDNNKG